MMSTLHFHYRHHGHGNLPHTDALKFDDGGKANQQLDRQTDTDRERVHVCMYVCMCATYAVRERVG